MIAFELDQKNGVPFYRQIINQIKFGMLNGSLNPGDKLPTVRFLAVQLKVNLNTVAKAYKELEILNVLETQQGTGTFISSVEKQSVQEDVQEKLEEICEEFARIATRNGISMDSLIKQLQKHNEK